MSYVALSKKRYYDLEEEFKLLFEDETVSKIMERIRFVMQFDPDRSTYTKEQAAKIKAYRSRMKEQGVSTYVTSGRKKYLENVKHAARPCEGVDHNLDVRELLVS